MTAKGSFLVPRMRLVAALVERDGYVTTPSVHEAEPGSNAASIAGWLWLRAQRGELARVVDETTGGRLRGAYTMPGAANALTTREVAR